MEAIPQIEGFIAVWMWICAFVASTAGLVAVVAKFWQWAHKTSDDNASKLEDVDTYLKSDKRRIEALEKSQEEMEKQQRLQLKALFTLLGHEVDGNHTAQLIEVRDEINEYLLNKV